MHHLRFQIRHLPAGRIHHPNHVPPQPPRRGVHVRPRRQGHHPQGVHESGRLPARHPRGTLHRCRQRGVPLSNQHAGGREPRDDPSSDTAIFVADYLSQILHTRADLRDRRKLNVVYQLAQSKFAIMDGSGYVATVGAFIHERGLLFSNGSYRQWGA